MNKVLNYINGELVAPSTNQFKPGINPATGEVFYQVADSTEADVDTAVAAAQRAFPAWRDLPVEKKSAILNRLAHLIEENLERLAQAECDDNGKPLALAKSMDIPRSAKNFEFYASCCSQFSSESHHMPGNAMNYTLRQPLGVVACISPWNLPLYLLTWKIAPALAAGNCVVAKPAQITPLTAMMLGELCQQAGFPAGVLNIVQGSGSVVGAALCKHPDIAAVSFTGGTDAGRQVSQALAPQFKKVSLELGGKNPAMIFADCDFEKMLETTVKSSFANQGQVCLCTSRILVERSIYDKFCDAFVAKVKALRVGDPHLEDTNLGALISKDHMEAVLKYIALAKTEGGKVLTGGEQIQIPGRCQNGSFVSPTVLTNLSSKTRINQEEIFGPVTAIIPFSNEEEALAIANDSAYGLAATLWTQDITRAHRLARTIQSGIVWINCWLLRDLRTPFGGMKDSGLGREGGVEAMRFFTEPRNICVKL